MEVGDEMSKAVAREQIPTQQKGLVLKRPPQNFKLQCVLILGLCGGRGRAGSTLRQANKCMNGANMAHWQDQHMLQSQCQRSPLS